MKKITSLICVLLLILVMLCSCSEPYSNAIDMTKYENIKAELISDGYTLVTPHARNYELDVMIDYQHYETIEGFERDWKRYIGVESKDQTSQSETDYMIVLAEKIDSEAYCKDLGFVGKDPTQHYDIYDERTFILTTFRVKEIFHNSSDVKVGDVVVLCTYATHLET